MINNVSEDNQFDSGGGRDNEGDEAGTSKAEDLEVRMDLTDDLLHMVCVASHSILLLESLAKFCICFISQSFSSFSSRFSLSWTT